MLQIISASRRTDLPRVFPELFAAWLKQRWVEVRNPFNQKKKLVSLEPENVHTIVLWSKDFSQLLANKADLKSLLKEHSQLYIQFTVTGMGGTVLEPGIVNFKKAINQFSKLIELAGDQKRVNWRFDPIVFYREKSVRTNLVFFDEMLQMVTSEGIKTATFSLCQWYTKSKRRAEQYGIKWIQPKTTRMANICQILLEKSYKYGILLKACCTPEVIPFGISKGECINGKLLTELHPKKFPVSLKKDSGQRKECGCTTSVDIGSYALNCPDGCVYCYANPISSSNLL